MTRGTDPRAVDGRRLAVLLVLLLGLGFAVAATRPTAVRAEGGGALVAEPVLAASAAGVTELFGASPAEAPGEVWGVGTKAGGAQAIVRYSDAGGWESLPEPIDAEGNSVTTMEIPQAASAGRTTPGGGVLIAARIGGGTLLAPEQTDALLVRDPGGQFRAIVPPEEIMEEGEELFEYTGVNQPSSLQFAAVEEATGKTGAFVVPHVTTIPNSVVLHYDGEEWSREPICLVTAQCEMSPLPASAKPRQGFKVIAIGAAEPENAWILATVPRKTGSGAGENVLLRREHGQWRKAVLGGALGEKYGSERPNVGGAEVFIVPRQQGQALTVTSKGVWVDATIALGTRESAAFDATFYLDTATGDQTAGQVTGAWCSLPTTTPEEVTAALCTAELPFDLPHGQARSFAWPGNGEPGEEFGARAITGIGKGAMLLFENGGFTRIPLAGEGGSSAGAAIAYPAKEGRGESQGLEGWLGPSYRLTREPVPSGLVSWPVPFRRPLTAVASQPGAPVGEIGTQALAVGEAGQVAKYIPGVGWQPESLLSGNGTRATPNLRGVAWPVPGLAFAVGDEGAMWIWRSGTNLWEPDPGAPPNLIRGNFTGIAFDPNEPERGYAVGQQGLLLGYGRSWTQEVLPPEIGPEPNITSIAFAGSEAIATWSRGVPSENPNVLAELVGGVIVNDGSGSGWRVENQATEALAAAEGEGGSSLSPRLVAGTPDGGAAIAGRTGTIVEREAAGGPWHAVPGAPLGTPVALQAIREGGQIRAIVSVEANAIKDGGEGPEKAELPQGALQPPEGQAPLLLEPNPLPASGYIVRQTTTGWRDEEHQSFPIPPKPTDQSGSPAVDVPKVPDPVLAFLVSPDGSRGWAVGGQTGLMALVPNPSAAFEREGLQTAAVMRLGEGAEPSGNASTVPVPMSTTEATFAIGGNAQCADVCADLSGTGIGPDVWLPDAVGKAAATPGVRAFLYTGSSVAAGLDLEKVTQNEFGEEEGAYARRLGSAAGALPVFTTPAETDRYEESLGIFGKRFEGYEQPLGAAAPAPGILPRSDVDQATGQYSYSFDSEGSTGGAVRVIVLDRSTAAFSTEQQCWLADELTEAGAPSAPETARPAIVIANREVGADAALRQLVVTGANETTALSCPHERPTGASAYFYDSPEANTMSYLAWGATAIPTFGTGSLGYLKITDVKLNELGAASGFLLASVNTAALDPSTNVAPVTARLIPSIGSLAINALNGTLLRRSQVALFEGLARRPAAGYLCSGNDAPGICSTVKPNPYVQIPARCVNRTSSCATELPVEYRFSSSRPDIADFVKVDPASSSSTAVYLNQEGKPEPDPTSGLLCAFNSGTTTVSIETGGLAYSVQVTVQQGSVARPCGTVRRTDLVAPAAPVAPPPLPAELPPSFKSPTGSLPPPQAPAPPPVVTPTLPAAQVPLPVAHHVPAKPPAPVHLNFFANSPGIAPIPVIVPPAPPAAAEPAPPTGTSPVTQPAVSPEPEEEEEAAFDMVHHAVAVRPAARAAAATAAYRFATAVGRHAVVGLRAALVGGHRGTFLIWHRRATSASRPGTGVSPNSTLRSTSMSKKRIFVSSSRGRDPVPRLLSAAALAVSIVALVSSMGGPAVGAVGLDELHHLVGVFLAEGVEERPHRLFDERSSARRSARNRECRAAGWSA